MANETDSAAAEFERLLAENGQALNNDGCLIPANTKGDGRPCECPCHTEGRPR